MSRLGESLFNLAGPAVVGGALGLLARSLRLRYEGFDHYKAAMGSGRPVIFAFWHEDTAGVFMTHVRLRHGPVGVMVSRSRDGEMLARVIGRHDLVPIRASSSRGAVRGFFELLRWLNSPPAGARLAVALDGPRGPRRRAKAGAAMLARKARALILPVTFRHSRRFVFRSWDRLALPLPFSATTVFFGAPLDAAAWEADDAANAQRIASALGELRARAGEP